MKLRSRLCVGCSLCCIQVSVTFFQHVLSGCQPSSGPWLTNAPLDHNSISEMMLKFSGWENLSKRQTNHCVRATACCDWPHGCWACTSQSMHCYGIQNAQSLEHYDWLDREGGRRLSEMAKVLDGETLMSSKTTKLKPSTKYTPDGSADGERIFGNFFLNEHAVIHRLTISVGTTTEQQQQQSVSSSSQTIWQCPAEERPSTTVQADIKHQHFNMFLVWFPL